MGWDRQVKEYEVREDLEAVRTEREEKLQVEASQPTINAIVGQLERK